MRNTAHHAGRGSCPEGMCDLILLDFSKAFDKVSHSKLLWKFRQYGMASEAKN